MKKNVEFDEILPGGKLYGLVGDDFYFTQRKNSGVLSARQDIPLEKYASWIRSSRAEVGLFQKIRVDMDFNPPVVETVYPRGLSQIVGMATMIAFWAIVVKIIL